MIAMIDLGDHQIIVDGARGKIKPVGTLPAALKAALVEAKPALLNLVGHRSILIDAATLRLLTPAPAEPGLAVDGVALGDGSELWRLWHDDDLIGSYDDKATADDSARVIAAMIDAQARLDAAYAALSEAERASWARYTAARLRAQRVPSGAATRAGVDVVPGAAADAANVATMDRLCAARSAKVPAGLLDIWRADQDLARANVAARWLP